MSAKLNWERDALVHALSALDLDRPQALPEIAKAYLRYYEMDFKLAPACDYNMGFIPHGNEAIFSHCWRPPNARATVFILHGLYDHSGLYRHVIEYLVSKNYAVVAFDLPGHGLSSGEPTKVDDFNDYIQALADLKHFIRGKLPKPYYVIAQSTGGAIVLDALHSKQLEFDKVVLLAPLIRPKGWEQVRIKYTLGKPWIKQVARRYMVNSNDEAFVDFLQHHDPLQSDVLDVRWVGAMIAWVQRYLSYGYLPQSLLVLQGDDDETVDWEYNLEEIKKRCPRLQLHMLPGAKHHLAHESTEYREEALNTILEYFQSASDVGQV